MEYTKGERFGQRLIREREARGYSQADLARAANISRGAISNYEAGRIDKPDPEVLRKIAKAMLIPEEMVFRWADLLSEKPEQTPRLREMKYLMDQLPEEEQQELIDLARLKVRRFGS